ARHGRTGQRRTSRSPEVVTGILLRQQRGSQSPDRTQVAHRRRRLGQPQQRGHLLIGQLFAVPHQDHLAVVVVQRGDGGLQPCLQFVPDGGAGGRRLAVEELSCQLERRLIVERRGDDRLFPVHAAPLGLPVSAVGVD